MIGRRSPDDAQSFEEAWDGGAPRDEHIAALVKVAEEICEAAAAEPTADFRASLRTRLMTEAETVLVPLPPEPSPVVTGGPSRARRRIAAVTAALVTSVGTVGIVTSSASALPGDMLYSVKRTVESVELTLHRGDASRGSFELAQASERLAEARELDAEGKDPALIAEALEDFATSASSGSAKLFAAFDTTGEEKSIRTISDFAAASTTDLSELAETLPADIVDSYAVAAEALSDLALKASTLCGTCAPVDVRDLAGKVTDIVKETPEDQTPANDTDRDGKAAASEPSPASTRSAPAQPVATRPAPSKTASTTDPAPTTPTPTPTTAAPTTKTPSLTDVTDPLLGGLLGDDEQEGLVPGLLGGLLGGSK